MTIITARQSIKAFVAHCLMENLYEFINHSAGENFHTLEKGVRYQSLVECDNFDKLILLLAKRLARW